MPHDWGPVLGRKRWGIALRMNTLLRVAQIKSFLTIEAKGIYVKSIG